VRPVPLCKMTTPGKYTEERNKWMEQLAANQGEFLKDLLIDSGIPQESIKVVLASPCPAQPIETSYGKIY